MSIGKNKELFHKIFFFVSSPAFKDNKNIFCGFPKTEIVWGRIQIFLEVRELLGRIWLFLLDYVPQTVYVGQTICWECNNTIILPNIFNMYLFVPQTIYVMPNNLCILNYLCVLYVYGLYMPNYCLWPSNYLCDAK